MVEKRKDITWLDSLKRIYKSGEYNKLYPEMLSYIEKYPEDSYGSLLYGKLLLKLEKKEEAKKVLEELFVEVKAPSKIIEEKGWVQISDEGAIKEVVLKILEANPQSVADFKAGKDRALGFLVGQAMKETKGKANPKMLNEMFLEELKK